MKLAPAQAEPDPLLEPGEYLLALSWLQRRTSRAGADYLLCGFVVVSGPARGRPLVATMGLDLSRPGTRGRWRVWREQCGVREEIDLGDDAAILRAFRARPFKARIRVDEPTTGRDAVNDIDVLIYPRLYSDEDRREIAHFLGGAAS